MWGDPWEHAQGRNEAVKVGKEKAVGRVLAIET